MTGFFFFSSTARDTACVILMWCSSFTTQTPFSSWLSPWSSSTPTCTLLTSNPNVKWDSMTSYATWEVSVSEFSWICACLRGGGGCLCVYIKRLNVCVVSLWTDLVGGAGVMTFSIFSKVQWRTDAWSFSHLLLPITTRASVRETCRDERQQRQQKKKRHQTWGAKITTSSLLSSSPSVLWLTASRSEMNYSKRQQTLAAIENTISHAGGDFWYPRIRALLQRPWRRPI